MAELRRRFPVYHSGHERHLSVRAGAVLGRLHGSKPTGRVGFLGIHPDRPSGCVLDEAVLDFFETSGRNLLAAEAAAGVRHHVAPSLSPQRA
jgi:hypothetical protein